MTPTKTRLFRDQVPLEIAELGREEPVRWLRIFPDLDEQSRRVIRRLDAFADSTDRLVARFETFDGPCITYVFTDNAASYVLAMVAIAETRGTISWRLEHGETAR